MMNVSYIANMRLPSERAHSVQIMRMCLAFARIGCETTLYVPSRVTNSEENAFDYYGIEQKFAIKKLWSIDVFVYDFVARRIAYWIGALTYSFSLLFRVFVFRRTIVFSRDPVSTFVLCWFVPRLIYEIHDTPKKTWLNRWMLRRVSFIVATNNHKKKILSDVFGVDAQKIFVAHHGVDAEKFSARVEREQALSLCGLDPAYRYVVYTGHLYDWKGVYMLARAAQQLPKHMRVCMVGGTEEDVAAMRAFCAKEGIEQVVCMGFQKHERIPLYVSLADVLVIPTSGRYAIGAQDSSPLKLFEYLASGKPIVASRIPAIGDIVSDKEVFFVEPDSPSKLAVMIIEASQNPHLKTQASQNLVAGSTWEKRARGIYDWVMKKNLS